jgi:hypothetical protein
VALVGNCIYWLFFHDDILVFDLDENSLSVITGPPTANNMCTYDGNRQIIQAEDGAVGFAILSYSRFQTWKRNADAPGGATWVPWMTIEMYRIPGLPPQTDQGITWLLGYDEDADLLFLHASGSVYGVQLKVMQSRKLYETHYVYRFNPFKSFYTPGDCSSFVFPL